MSKNIYIHTLQIHRNLLLKIKINIKICVSEMLNKM